MNRGNVISRFLPLTLIQTEELEKTSAHMSGDLIEAFRTLPKGENYFWGIPFNIEDSIIISGDSCIRLSFTDKTKGYPYLVFLHTADIKDPPVDIDGFLRPMIGKPILGDLACEFTFKTTSGKVFVQEIKRRYEIGEVTAPGGENTLLSVPHRAPYSVLTATDAAQRGVKQPEWWGGSQGRVKSAGGYKANWYLYALKNPFIDEDIVAFDISVPDGSLYVLSALTLCSFNSNPLIWETRKKIRVQTPAGTDPYEEFDRFKIDMGCIISVSPYMDYVNDEWNNSYNNKLPIRLKNEAIIEYTAHPDAQLTYGDNQSIPFKELEDSKTESGGYGFIEIAPALRAVKIKVIDDETGMPTPVKFHAHGEHGEYLAPQDRHRIINSHWFEDYSVDFVHQSGDSNHYCTYINGETNINLPLGKVFIEIAKGYEIKPLHLIYQITAETEQIIITLEKVLPWRKKGWVCADTHVHFLSPHSALLEGEGEGVNVVNLLASQWGELFTNIGDFDGKSVIKNSDEYMVRVGTENRQNTLGHISLLGYDGSIILPLTTGGPNESALGDGIEIGLCGWAKKTLSQNGVVVIPHFPHPRAEHAAVIALGYADGVEMTAWNNLYNGISPYSLSDWYRYLNCGYHVAVVGGTDKMMASTAVGTIRTYSYVGSDIFTFERWKQSMRTGQTFVTYGPLLDFHVEGKRMGETVILGTSGGTLDITWSVSSCTVPVTRVELVANGETVGEKRIDMGLGDYTGQFSFKTSNSCWLALRVRGHYPDQKEILAAHSSAVMVNVDSKPCFNSLDALSILEQIEGTTAYVKSMGTKAQERQFKAVIAELVSAHRALHNKMHLNGVYHDHSAPDNHAEHY